MKRSRILIPVALVLAVAAALGFYWPLTARRAELNLHGTVEIQEVRLSSKVGGRVKAVLVEEGARVQAGQPLVEIEPPELEAQKLQTLARIDAAAAQRDKAYAGARSEERRLAAAAVKVAEARWRRLYKGFRPDEVEQARGELASLEAELGRADLAHEREAKLYPHATAKADYDTTVAALGRARGQVTSARAKLRLMIEGHNVEEIAEARAELERAQANRDLVEAGTRSEELAELDARVAELHARLREIEVNLREAVVIAPEPAVVEVLPVRPGDVVAPNQPVARVLRANDVWVKAFVPEIELGKVRQGQSVEVGCDSFPGKRFAGTITYIASTSEFTPRNVQSYDERRHQVFALKVRVADGGTIFKSGMAAQVWLPLEETPR